MGRRIHRHQRAEVEDRSLGPMSTLPLIVEPDPDDPGCASLFVDGAISGRLCRFLLDTGAARTQVLEGVIGESATREGKDASSGVFATRPQRLATIEDLVIGPLRLPALEVAVADPAAPNAEPLLGMDVLRSARLDLRLSEQTLSFAGSEQRAWYPLRFDRRVHPYTDVRWGDVTAAAVIDTGAGITIVDRTFAEGHPEFIRPVGTSVGTDATGASVETPTVMIAAPQIAGVTIPPHRGAVVDLSAANATLDEPMDLIVGYTTLAYGDWTLDFPNRRWAFVRLDIG